MPSSRGSSRPRDQILLHLRLLHCRQIVYCLSHREDKMILVIYSFMTVNNNRI